MLNTIFKEVIDFLRDRFSRYEKRVELEKSVQGRFLHLFEEHGIHKNQIPSTFGHGITLQDVVTPEKLLARLDDHLLEDASQLFGVSLEWLMGASDQIFPVDHFYKDVDRFVDFVRELKVTDKFFDADIYLNTDNSWGDDAVLLIRTGVGLPYSDEVSRSYICGGWTHVYGKCRADLVACIAILLNKNINVQIHWVKGSLDSFAKGNEFPSSLLSMKRDRRVTSKLSKFFRAEKWVTVPNYYEYLLAEGTYGKLTAISRWLEHYESGYMDIGDGQDLEIVAERFMDRYVELGGKDSVT